MICKIGLLPLLALPSQYNYLLPHQLGNLTHWCTKTEKCFPFEVMSLKHYAFHCEQTHLCPLPKPL